MNSRFYHNIPMFGVLNLQPTYGISDVFGKHHTMYSDDDLMFGIFL